MSIRRIDLNGRVDRHGVIELRKRGMTYKEIAAEMGVSISSVYRICKGEYGSDFMARNGIVYPIIARWMEANHMTISQLAHSAGISDQHIKRILGGENMPNKRSIDGVLRATGLKYEDAFATSEKDD